MFRTDLVNSISIHLSPCLGLLLAPRVCLLVSLLVSLLVALLVSLLVSLLVAPRGSTLEMTVWRIRIAALNHCDVTGDPSLVSSPLEGHDVYVTPLLIHHCDVTVDHPTARLVSSPLEGHDFYWGVT